MRTVGLLGLAMIAASVASAGAAVAKPSGDCSAARSETVKRSAKVRAYRLGREASDYRVCFKPTGRVTRLAPFVDGPLRVDAIRGAFVAVRYTDTFYDRNENQHTYVEVVDARRGSSVVDADAFPEERGVTPPPRLSPVQILRDGTAAWIVRDESDPARHWRVLLALPDRETVRTLDTSAAIDPRSLALVPGFVYWTRGGVAQASRQ